MSVKSKLLSAWKILTSDPGVLVGTVQVIVSVSDLIVRQINRRRDRQEPGKSTPSSKLEAL